MIARLAALAGAFLLLWFLEGRRPLVHLGPGGRRPVAPNLVLDALTIATNVAITAALRSLWPGGRSWDGAPVALAAAAGVAALDLCGWIAHLLLHKMAWGWRIHRVHHSDRLVDVSTAFRQHPGETLWRGAWRAGPAVALGLPLAVVALYELLSALNALLEHANVAVPERAERVLRTLFVTPHLHKWHHSRDAAETDTNYGNIFSIWDRLFGTFTGRGHLGGIRYGLDGFDAAEAQSVGGLLKMPAAALPQGRIDTRVA